MAGWPRLMGLALVGLFLMGAPRLAGAQAVGVYAGGSLAVSPWHVKDVAGGSPSVDTSNTTTDASVVDFVGEAGWNFNRSGAVGVEVGLPLRRVEVTTRAAYFESSLSVSRYREQTVLVVARGLLHEAPHLRLEAVGGGGIVRQSALTRGASGPLGTQDFGPLGPETEVRFKAFGVTGGVDMAIAAGRHLSVVPTFRMLILARGDPSRPGSSFAYLGLPKVTYRFGIGARASF